MFLFLSIFVSPALYYTLEGTTITIYGDGALSKTYYQSTGNFIKYTDIILGEGITGLESEAFVGSTSLKNIYLPSTLQKIHYLSFRFCGQIESVKVAKNSTYFINDKSGLLLSYDGKTLVKAPAKGINRITIPTTVKSLSRYCLHKCNVDSILIPWSVSFLDYGVFVESSIKTIVFDDNSTIQSLENFFIGWCSITSIRVPKSVTLIDQAFRRSSIKVITFQEGSMLKTVTNSAFNDAPIERIEFPEGLTTIGVKAIENVPNLKYISIPSTVNSISVDAFDMTTNLETIICENNPHFLSLNDKALYNAEKSILYVCSSLIEEFEIGENMEEVGKTLLQGCYKLVSLIVSNSSKKYSEHDGVLYNKNQTIALAVIGGMTSVRFVNTCIKLEEYCCYSCYLLKSVTVPESLHTISHYSFAKSGLESITLTSSIREIGDYAFIECINLSKIDYGESKPSNVSNRCFYSTGLISITIPSTASIIGEASFQGCSLLEKVSFAQGSLCTALSYRSFKSCSKLATIELPSSLNSIGSECFQFNTLLNISLKGLPNLRSIDGSAFGQCNVSSIEFGSELTSIGSLCFTSNQYLEIADLGQTKIQEIGSSSFSDCIRLEKVILPNNLAILNPLVFTGCSSLKNVDTTNSLNFENYKNLVYLKGLKTMVMCPGGIPNAELSNEITNIGPNSFYFCSMLQKVEFPDECKVSDIPAKTFYQCISLQSLTIPPLVEEIKNSAFFSCSSLSRVEFMTGSLLRSIDNNTFEGCERLSEVIFREGYLKTIGMKAFFECNSLKSITLPPSLLSLGTEVFSGCSNLTNITFSSPSNITALESKLFQNCVSLTSISLPDSLVTLSSGCFEGCVSLQCVLFKGDSLKNIADNAFKDLNINEINFSSNIQLNSIGNNAFAGTKLVKICIPIAESIGEGIFENCKLLCNVDFTAFEKFGSIPSRSFYGCTSLSAEIEKISVKSIGDESFYGCSNLCLYLYNYKYISGKLSFSLNNSITSIGRGTFRHSNIGQNLFLGPNIKTIGESAFVDTHVQHVYFCGLENITTTGTLLIFNSGTVAFVRSEFEGNFCGLPTLHVIDADCSMPSVQFTANLGTCSSGMLSTILLDRSDLRE